MLIDWFTVIAQIVNFLILVFLLKHFLYDRIIQAMDKREERMRNRLKEADTKKEEAQQQAENYTKKQEEIKGKQEKILKKAKDQAEQERKDMVRKAREETETLRQRWHETLENEKQGFLMRIRRMSARQVYSVSRKALQDLADSELEARIIDVFISRLGEIPRDQKERMHKAATREGHHLKVKSGFELTSGQRSKVTGKIHNEIAENAVVDYETDAEIIMGIEVKVPGGKVAWNLEDYLAGLEKQMEEAFNKEIMKG